MESLYSLGASKSRLVLGMFGGANMLDDNELFKIGIKNTRATKKFLWQQSFSLHYEDVGGSSSRTVSLDIPTGQIGLKKDGKLHRI